MFNGENYSIEMEDKMKTSYMKSLKPCFGTKNFGATSKICLHCQFVMKCWRNRKRHYPTLKKPELLKNDNK